MSSDFKSTLDNADMQAVPRALHRAALRAREVAYRTHTSLVLDRDGALVEETVTAEDLLRDATELASSLLMP